MKSSHLTEWFDDDSFWRSFYPVLISRTEVRRRTRGSCAGRRAGKACWHGRARLVLRPRQDRGSATQSGLTVTGVDRSKSFLAKARRRAEAANVNVEWVQSDMRDFVRADSFDLALSMFTSLGYFDNKEEDLDVLRNVLASLKPRGSRIDRAPGKGNARENLPPRHS